MSELNRVAMRWALGAIFVGGLVRAQVPAQAPDPRTYVPPVIKPRGAAPPRRPAHSRPSAPSAAAPGVGEDGGAGVSALGSTRAFSPVGHESAAPGTPLTAPVSIVYGGNSIALSVTDAASEQPAIMATTAGLGSAIVGTVTTTARSFAAGVQGISGAQDGAGVIGYGGGDDAVGVYGSSDASAGVSAESYTGTGLFAISDDGPYGIQAVDDYGTAIYAYTDKGTGLYVYGETSGVGINVSTFQGDGIDVSSINGPAIYAQSGGLYESATRRPQRDSRARRPAAHFLMGLQERPRYPPRGADGPGFPRGVRAGRPG